MYKKEIIEYCLTLENAHKDFPLSNDFESVTMKIVICHFTEWLLYIVNYEKVFT